MLRWFRDITLIFTLLFGVAGGGWAASHRNDGLSGSVSIGSASYRAEVDGTETVRASHLYQQYSVMYSQEKKLYSGRAGSYTLMLGYEHSVLNPSLTFAGVDDADVDAMTRNKLFYQGGLTLAPGGLPFRLQMWAQDINRSSFTPGSLGTLPLGLDANHGGNLFNPRIFTDIANGTRRSIGGTLLIGIRNGSYLGSYRDVLSQLPRLLVDFRQEDVEDTASRFTPVKYRQRDLAFVSLNKKDNWVHYRVHDFTDYLNPANNVMDTQVLIGTIDHTKKREWINLTNWIKFSSDLSYSSSKQLNVAIPTRTYAFNLLGLAARSGQQASLLSSYQRVMDASGIMQYADLPIQAAYEMNRNTRIVTRLAVTAQENSLYEEFGAADDNVDSTRNSDLFFDIRADLNRTGQLLYRPHFQAERRNESKVGGSTSLKLGGDVSTNNALSRANAWLLGFDVATVQGESMAGGFSQIDLYGRVDREPDSNWRYGSRANLSYGTGQASAGSNGARITVLSEGGSAYDPLADEFSGNILQTLLALYGEHRSSQWANRLEVTHERRGQSGGESENQVSAEHSLRYEERQGRFEWKSAVEYGDRSSARSISGDYLLTSNADALSKMFWNSMVSYEQTPNRQKEMSVTGGLKGTTEQTLYYVAQKLGYTLYTSNGIVRRIAICDEELSYEGLVRGEGLERTSATRLKLSAGIFPTHSYYLLGTAEYVLLQPSAATITVLTANTGFNFQQLKVNLSYSLGNKGEESEFLPGVTEQRWSFDVKKIF